MKKLLCFFLTALIIFAGVPACSKTRPIVILTLWGPEEAKELLQQFSESFVEEYMNEAQITVLIGSEAESTVGSVVTKSPENAADVFIFPSDQLHYLIDDGILLPITGDVNNVINSNGGLESPCIKSAMRADKLYAYPQTSSNGYFMYYNKSYFNDEDVLSLDRMLEIAAENGKYVSMDWTSGWYLYSFFEGAGFRLEMNGDGVNECNWNQTVNGIPGTDVANAMLHISESKGFLNADNTEFMSGIADGTIIAGVNGTWNAQYVNDYLGENFGACKLPTYTLNDTQVQMGSFTGYKYVGVNSCTDNPEWASKLASWITNYENQMLLFSVRGECPSNIEAAKSPEVQASEAIAALGSQSQFSQIENVESSFWNASTVFGTLMASGNPDKIDLQVILDDLVEAVTSPGK